MTTWARVERNGSRRAANIYETILADGETSDVLAVWPGDTPTVTVSPAAGASGRAETTTDPDVTSDWEAWPAGNVTATKTAAVEAGATICGIRIVSASGAVTARVVK